MSDRQEFRHQLAARLRQVARDLLDHVAIADNQEQKRQLVRRALRMTPLAGELLSFASTNERLPIAEGTNAMPATEAEQVAGASRWRSGANASPMELERLDR
jgi:hypothetical protein